MKTFLGATLFTVGFMMILAATTDPVPGTMLTDELLVKYMLVGLAGVFLTLKGWTLMDRNLGQGGQE